MEAVIIVCKYFDGHYNDSGLPIEEREKALEEALKEDENLTEWTCE